MSPLRPDARRALARLAGSLGAIALEQDLAGELVQRGFAEPIGSGYVITATGIAAQGSSSPPAAAPSASAPEDPPELTDPLF